VSSKDDFTRGLVDASLVQHCLQWDASPVSGADGAAEPRLADWARLEKSPPVTGALERHTCCASHTSLQVSQPEAQPPFDAPFNGQTVAGSVYERNVVVRECVVQAGWRAFITQRLQRKCPVAQGELQLLRVEESAGLES